MNFTSQVVNNFLNIYWIGGQDALWRSLDVLELKDIPFKRPILDLGCGNGVFSFTRAGGQFHPDFDVYRMVSSTSGFHKGRDIYNQTSKFKPKILKKPKYQIDYGLDWKQNLVDNAKPLKLYKNFVVHDMEKPLPFPDDTFATIFSNTFYWITNVKQLFSECYRILKKNGILVICVPTEKFPKYLIYDQYLKHPKYTWAKTLDRGTYSNTKHCYSYLKWKSIFSPMGFTVEHHSTYLSEKFVKFAQVAMRPYIPFITDMANNLNPEIRRKIKTRLINELVPLTSSYIEYERDHVRNGGFHLFVLKK